MFKKSLDKRQLLLYTAKSRRGVVQLVEQRSPKPCVACSIRVSPAKVEGLPHVGGLFVFILSGVVKMKSKLCFMLAVIVVFVGIVSTSVCAASPETSVPATSTCETAIPTSSASEDVKTNRSKQWIFFAITSVLSLAVAIPLAIRSGNKKYGK